MGVNTRTLQQRTHTSRRSLARSPHQKHLCSILAALAPQTTVLTSEFVYAQDWDTCTSHLDLSDPVLCSLQKLSFGPGVQTLRRLELMAMLGRESSPTAPGARKRPQSAPRASALEATGTRAANALETRPDEPKPRPEKPTTEQLAPERPQCAERSIAARHCALLFRFKG